MDFGLIRWSNQYYVVLLGNYIIFRMCLIQYQLLGSVIVKKKLIGICINHLMIRNFICKYSRSTIINMVCKYVID